MSEENPVAEHVPNKKQKKSKKLRLRLLLVLLIAMAIAAGLYIRSHNKSSNASGNITYSTNEPNESKKDADNYKWTGSPNDPRKIIIQKINVDAYVQKAGIDQNKKVAVPNNVHLAAWFTESVRPGENGLSIIDGHVSGRKTEGVFKNLKNLQKGDTFVIERGNGTKLTFKVFETRTVPEGEAAAILFSQNPKVLSQLNLITCGGEFNKKSQQYSDRVIISAQLKN
jgi:LPXTG-site transpeptidase (sortase) family protein